MSKLRGLARNGIPAVVIASVLTAFLAPTSAIAAEASGHSETVLLAQIVVLLAAGAFMGELMQRLGQPAVMGQLLAGVMLGPSVLGALWPAAQQALFPPTGEQKAMLAGIAQFGILLLLLLTGMETDLKLARKVGKTSLVIAATGLTVPFACGFALGESLPSHLLPQPDLRLVTSLFLGTALSISSVKIVAVVVREMDFMRRDIGQVIIAAAIIEDTIGWIIIALIFGIATHGALDAVAFGKSLIGTLLFLAASFTIGQRLVARLIRWANDGLVSELPVITVLLIVMGVMALITDAIGVHTVLGAFVAGTLVGQSPILTRHIDEQLRGMITTLFMPVFFAVAGLSADLSVLADPTLLALTAGLLAIASVGKFGGAFLGGRLGGLTFGESLAIGSAMNARGSTEVIVASIGLSMGALSQNLYTMIVAMAVLTTMAMPPLLRWTLQRLPLRDEERLRLEQEAREARGFVTNFERVLLTVDDSANARFGAHLAGLIAGTRQILTTVLQLSEPGSGELRTADRTPPDLVRSAAQEAHEAVSPDEKAPADPEVTAHPANVRELPAAAVGREVRKGYDLLMIAVDRPVADDGLISAKVTDLAHEYEGPLAIVDARGGHLVAASPRQFSILLPIRGAPHSQRAAEFAIEMARATHSSVEAVYVADGGSSSWRRRATRASDLEEEAALRQVITLAESSGVNVQTSVERGGAAAVAMLRLARRRRHDLIVLGVTRRPGEQLFFGKVASEVLKDAPCSVLLVCS